MGGIGSDLVPVTCEIMAFNALNMAGETQSNSSYPNIRPFSEMTDSGRAPRPSRRKADEMQISPPWNWRRGKRVGVGNQCCPEVVPGLDPKL